MTDLAAAPGTGPGTTGAAAGTATGPTATDPTVPGYDAVLLAGFGGPEGPDDVMPFLRNVTRGRGIPEERLIEVSHHYQALGGVSPINAQSRALREALEDELRTRGIELPVLWGNRNWAPFVGDVIVDAHRDGLVRLLGVATSAYSSYSSCRQYREDFGMALERTGLVGSVRVDKVRPYFDQPGFLAPFVDGTVEALREATESGLAASDLEVVFTTHSVPNTMGDTSGSATLDDHGNGGAYVTQHLAVAREVMAQAEKALGAAVPTWQLGYQSRSGPPSMPWLEPDINDIIDGLATAGRRGVIVVPIGFVSDHVEVVWDLDNEALETAQGHELFFRRVRTPGTDPRFVADLADLVVRRLSGTTVGYGAGVDASAVDLPARPDFCAPGCCRNSRGAKPTTAAVDSAADWAGLEVTGSALVASGIPGTLPA